MEIVQMAKDILAKYGLVKQKFSNIAVSIINHKVWPQDQFKETVLHNLFDSHF